MTDPFSLVLQIKEYEKLDSEEERLSRSRQIYDTYIMKELLSCSHVRMLQLHSIILMFPLTLYSLKY